jgi:hypothetical protein
VLLDDRHPGVGSDPANCLHIGKRHKRVKSLWRQMLETPPQRRLSSAQVAWPDNRHSHSEPLLRNHRYLIVELSFSIKGTRCRPKAAGPHAAAHHGVHPTCESLLVSIVPIAEINDLHSALGCLRQQRKHI